MVKQTFSIPDELFEEFDRRITEQEYEGEIPHRTTRSRIIQELVKGYVDGRFHIEFEE